MTFINRLTDSFRISFHSFHGDDSLWSGTRHVRSRRRFFLVHEPKVVFQQYFWQLSVLRREILINQNNSFL